MYSFTDSQYKVGSLAVKSRVKPFAVFKKMRLWDRAGEERSQNL